jgi:hypothetical protein
VLTTETPPRRFIQVFYLVIQQGDRILIEAEQTLRDGRVRRRGRPPAEKIQGVESAESAALRCLHEELRITGSDFKIVRRANGSIHEISESPSYPGLLTLYAMHIVDVYGLELPTHNFVRVELQTSAENAVKRHEWAWRLPNSDDLIRFAPTNSEVFALNP